MKQYLSVPVQYETSTQLQEDDLKIPVEILVMHDKVNLNNSNFEIESIETAKESIKNIPILGYIKKIDGSDLKDFAGHEMEIVFKDGEVEVVYLERPIGVVPESNQYDYVEKNGKKYVKVIGYLWKDYLNSGYEILQENPNKSVSMEIVVDSYEVRKDGIVDIKAYRYTGITVLGDNVLPGMQGANMQVLGQFESNQKFSKEFYERVEKLNNELNSISLEGGETEPMSKEKEGDNVELFSATYRQKRECIQNALDPVIVRDEKGNLISETYYWLDDFTDTHCMVEKYVWTLTDSDEQYGRFTYSFDDKELKATITSDFEKLIKTALTQEEYNKVMTERDTMSAEFEQLKTKLAEFEALQAKVNEYESTITEKDNQISQLTEYKNKNEFQIAKFDIETLIEEFESTLADNDEFKTLKENINASFEKGELFIKLESLEKELYAIEGRVKHKPKETKQKKQNFSRVSVDINTETTPSGQYGSAEKYIPR